MFTQVLEGKSTIATVPWYKKANRGFVYPGFRGKVDQTRNYVRISEQKMVLGIRIVSIEMRYSKTLRSLLSHGGDTSAAREK